MSDVPNCNNSTGNNLKYDLFFGPFTQLVRTPCQQLMELNLFENYLKKTYFFFIPTPKRN